MHGCKRFLRVCTWSSALLGFACAPADLDDIETVERDGELEEEEPGVNHTATTQLFFTVNFTQPSLRLANDSEFPSYWEKTYSSPGGASALALHFVPPSKDSMVRGTIVYSDGTERPMSTVGNSSTVTINVSRSTVYYFYLHPEFSPLGPQKSPKPTLVFKVPPGGVVPVDPDSWDFPVE